MKMSFYPKLAVSSILKNKRMFVPYIFTCIGMIMMFYIVMFLGVSDILNNLRGGETIRIVLSLGSQVIAVFSGIFLFYTNSFLARRRKKEFGLYNILGMGKGNIGIILFWETLIIGIISIGIGLLAGIIFSKLAELVLVNLMGSIVNYTFSISIISIERTIQVFGIIFILILINSIRQVQFSSAINLMRSENVGEKPPKGNWFIGIMGILILVVAYYISVTIQEPIQAILIFSIAVIMVIIGTYFTMISGSVVFLRILKKRRRYYYKTNHFISVSSMIYRMKRNGAGLASICILATMVLVMMASTACLYFGKEDAINTRYPRDINLEFSFDELDSFSDENIKKLKDKLSTELRDRNIIPENRYFYRNVAIYGIVNGSDVETTLRNYNLSDGTSTYSINFVSLDDYNEVMNTNETLNDGEALLYSYRNSYKNDKISFNNGKTFNIKRNIDNFVKTGDSAIDMLFNIILIVPDIESVIKSFDNLSDFYGEKLARMSFIYNFDTGIEVNKQIEVYNSFLNIFTDESIKENFRYKTVYLVSQEFERESFNSLFGAVFYI
ncbi:FtsX-like permease family protein [Candidatus Arthromitus sp. SFB-mouse]|nr:FtsX-like permease family protein [Candidatus Arthromitus sp. SFB-mouse]